MDPIISQQLEALRNKWPDQESQEEISTWEKQLKNSSMFLNLQEHGAFRIIWEGFQEEIRKIDKELHDNEALFKDAEGQMLGRVLHARKRFIKDFFRPFQAASVNVEYHKEKIGAALSETN